MIRFKMRFAIYFLRNIAQFIEGKAKEISFFFVYAENPILHILYELVI